jgi:hypothetical protein
MRDTLKARLRKLRDALAAEWGLFLLFVDKIILTLGT